MKGKRRVRHTACEIRQVGDRDNSVTVAPEPKAKKCSLWEEVLVSRVPTQPSSWLPSQTTQNHRIRNVVRYANGYDTGKQAGRPSTPAQSLSPRVTVL